MDLPSATSPPLPPARFITAMAPEAYRRSYQFEPFGDDGLTFFDILDAINPLQHLPIISTIYRALTDDDIAPLPRIAGGALFGGLIGAITSAVNVIVDEITGSDIGAHVLAFLGDITGLGGDDAEGAVATASTETVTPVDGFEPPSWAGTPVTVSSRSASERYARAAAVAAPPPTSAGIDVLG